MVRNIVLLSLTAMLASVIATPTKAAREVGMLSARQDPNDILEFDCSSIPEVCTNMCFGAFCLPSQGSSQGQSLRYDVPDSATKSSRRTAAGCRPSPNRCSTQSGYMAGYNCDEYPFASTILQSGTATRVNRCVPSGQNSMQGGAISAFYSGSYCNGGPCNFNVGFGNPDAAGVNYCEVTPSSGDCTSDGNEVVGPNNPPQKRTDEVSDLATISKRTNVNTMYKLSDNTTIAVPGGASIGQRVWRIKAIDQALWMAQGANHTFDENAFEEQYDYMRANLRVIEDYIAAKL